MEEEFKDSLDTFDQVEASVQIKERFYM